MLSLPIDDDQRGGRVRYGLDGHTERTDLHGRWRCCHSPLHLAGLTIEVDHDKYARLEIGEAASRMQLAELQVEKAAFTMKKEPPVAARLGGLTMHGRVTDAQGKPVADAKVTLDGLAGNGELVQGPTDSDGRYCFTDCSPGQYKLIVMAHRLALQWRNTEVWAHMPSIDFQLSAGHPIRIRVVDTAGNPLAGVYVRSEDCAFGDSFVHADSLVTDRDGRWESRNSLESKASFVIYKSGFTTAYRDLAGREEEQIVTLRPPIRISGRVVDTVTKRPVRTIHISTKQIETGPQPTNVAWLISPSVAVDDEGRYEVVLDYDVPGMENMAWQLDVVSPGYVTQVSRKLKASEGSQVLDFEMAPGKTVK